MKNIDKQILEYLQTLPKKKVTTYKSIAEKFQVHPRKVAAVMRYNKNPETYPCYKVIASNGEVSGYNTKGGVDEKIDKLQKDGIEIINGKIGKEYIIK